MMDLALSFWCSMGVKEDLESLKEGLSNSVTPQQQQQLQDAGYTTKDLLASAHFDDLIADPPKLPRAVARLICEANQNSNAQSLFPGITPEFARLEGWHNEGWNRRYKENMLTLRGQTTKTFLMGVQKDGVKVSYGPPRSGKTVQCGLLGHLALGWPQVFGKVLYANLATVKKNDPSYSFEAVFLRETGETFADATLSPASSPEKAKRPKVDKLQDTDAPEQKPDKVPAHLQTLIILDEVHRVFDREATKSGKLWDLVKCITPSDDLRFQLGVQTNCRLWLAGSRGSNPFGGIDDASPVEIPNQARIPLRTADGSTGLMFDWEEFTDYFEKFCTRLGARADDLGALKLVLSSLTEGHIGALSVLMDRIKTDVPFENFTPDAWQTKVIEEHLVHESVLTSLQTNRGFPRADILAKISASELELIRILLQNFGKVKRNDLATDQLHTTADQLVKNGWLMMELKGSPTLTFPSPIHMEYYRKVLGEQRYGTDKELPASLLELLLTAFTGLKSKEFLESWSESLHGKKHEVLFQHLLYRQLCLCLPSTQTVSPAVGPAFGMSAYLDIFIWPMQVGIELLRDGIKAKEHAERWLPNERYYDFIQSGLVKEWATIDIRNPAMRQLYRPRADVLYIQFADDWKSFTVTVQDEVKQYSLTE